jgi:hypothetical protein
VKDLTTLTALFAVDSNYGRWPDTSPRSSI